MIKSNIQIAEAILDDIKTCKLIELYLVLQKCRGQIFLSTFKKICLIGTDANNLHHHDSSSVKIVMQKQSLPLTVNHIAILQM